MQALTPPQCASGPHHRRVHSDLLFRIPDGLGPDIPFMAGAGGNLPDLGSEDDLFHMYLDMENVASGSEVVPNPDPDPVTQPKHRQSLSVGELGYGFGEAKKAMAPDKLAELAVVDPKRMKRILANRQSAARSKERKARYISELERKVQALQFEQTTLSAQLSLLERDTTGLTMENNELKLRLQVMEQQAQLHDALNGALKNEVERLKFATGEATSCTDAYNMERQQFPLDESLPPLQHQQQQFSFHRGIQSPHRELCQPPQPCLWLAQPNPTSSNQQILVKQHDEEALLDIDHGLLDIKMPQDHLWEDAGIGCQQ